MAVVKPKQTELSVSYSVGVKAQIVKYELTADAHVSRSEKFNVEGMTPEQVAVFYDERYTALKLDLDARISAEYDEMMGKN